MSGGKRVLFSVSLAVRSLRQLSRGGDGGGGGGGVYVCMCVCRETKEKKEKRE